MKEVSAPGVLGKAEPILEWFSFPCQQASDHERIDRHTTDVFTKLQEKCFIDFVDSVLEILRMSVEERASMRDAARRSVDRFTEANFEKRWNYLVGKLLRA